MKASLKVREFCGKLTNELDRERFGDIDPFIFFLIADGDIESHGELGLDAQVMAKILEKIL